MSLYNGNRFPFDLTDFRALEASVFDACISVLRMDGEVRREVHTYFKNGDEIWQEMIARWGFKDHYAQESWR